VRMMNDRARERGLTNSYFANVDGRPDPQMRTTAREMAQLARSIIAEFPEYYKWFGLREFTWNKIRQQNRNPLLGLLDGADGMKTGSTSEAGFNLVGSAKRGEQRLIVVVTGLKTAKERVDEAKKILEFGFREFETRMLFAQDQPIAEAKVFGGTRGKVAVVAKENVRLLVPRSGNERISARMVYTGPLQAPVREGQTVGRLQINRGSLRVLEVPLLAAENVDQGSLTQRAMDAASELVINLFRTAVKSYNRS
jgi:serine-type D-Ala-D-Ala carboxypeptidase (penicillin-binding protein 5/6)